MPNKNIIFKLRIFLMIFILLSYLISDYIQILINNFYNFLLSHKIFRLSFFETLFVPFLSIIIYVIYSVLEENFPSLFLPYKIDKRTKYSRPKDIPNYAKTELLTYILPLFTLDLIIPKRFFGADWNWNSWIQIERALPSKAPLFGEIVLNLVLSFLIFDTLFFMFHLLIHKNEFLYKNLHQDHHDHLEVNIFTTNKLSIVERIILVLSANMSLNIFWS